MRSRDRCGDRYGGMGFAPSVAAAEKEVPLVNDSSDAKMEALKPLITSFSHPCLLPITSLEIVPGADSDETNARITRELIAPGSLHGLAHHFYKGGSRAESLPPGWTGTTPVVILYGVATGLKYLHSQGVGHRAVSLGNVVLDDSLRPRLADYCIWQDTTSKCERYLTFPFQCFFLAPEELAAHLELKCLEGAEPADIYAFAMLMYVLLLREFPKRTGGKTDLTKSARTLLAKSRSEFDDFVRSGGRPDTLGLVPDVAAFLQRCWDADPDNRPSIDDVLTFLRSRPAGLGFPNVDVAKFRAYRKQLPEEGGDEEEEEEEDDGGAIAPIVAPPPGPPPETKAAFLQNLGNDCAAAQFLLGQMYENGEEVDQDVTEAFRYYRRAADLGLHFAQLKCGMMLHQGVGCDRNIRGAIQCYESAAKQGNADAMNNLGVLIEIGELPLGMRAAVDYYKAAALRSNEPGRANYARCLEFGIGVPENPRLASIFGATRYDTKVSRAIRMFKANRYDDAAALFRQAADDGDASAAFNLAWMAERGLIRAPDGPVPLYQQAADRGSPDAQNNLALLLIKAGRVDEARSLLISAADAGNAYALNNLAIIVEQGKVGGDLGIVPTLYRQAADAGLPEGMMNYAELLESGAEIRRNTERARAFYALAFEKSRGKLASAGDSVRRLRD